MSFSTFIRQLLIYADMDMPVKKVVNGIAKLAVAATLITGAILYKGPLFYFLLGTALAPILTVGAIIAFFYFQGAQRASVTEEVLPEALALMATNLKSGLTPDRALLMTARPEFGPLEKEMRMVAKESLTTIPFEDALMEIARKFNSMTIGRTMKLVSEGIKRGGEISTILESTAKHIREINALKRHIAAEATLQMLFIMFAAVIAAPLMFGTSTVIIEKISSLGVGSDIEAPRGVGASLPKTAAIAPAAQYMLHYAVAAVTLNSLFASFIVGLIKEGKKVSGLRYFPVILLVSLLVMFLTRFSMASALRVV